jgi:hypothetical protein
MIDRLPSSRLLRGHRGRPACDLDAVVDALLAMSQLAGELGDHIEALDVNPLIVSSTGAVAVDVLVTPLQSRKASQPEWRGYVPPV